MKFPTWIHNIHGTHDAQHVQCGTEWVKLSEIDRGETEELHTPDGELKYKCGVYMCLMCGAHIVTRDFANVIQPLGRAKEWEE